jgi:hypothetical protein
MPDQNRYEEARRLRNTGLTLKAVGAALGVSGERVRSMLNSLEREERRSAKEAADPSLIPWNRGLEHATYLKLYRARFESREECMALASNDLTPSWRGYVRIPGWVKHKNYCTDGELVLPLALVNEVRAWLGAVPLIPTTRIASAKELERARRLLERHGWTVLPPCAVAPGQLTTQP